MSQSPSVEQIRIKNVAGTYVQLEWDDIGGLFTYEIQKSANGGAFIPADFSTKPSYFDQNATISTVYIYRVRSVSTEYTPSEWAYTEQFTTFETNSYAVVSQSSVNIYKNFIDQKLTYADDFINFNRDDIEAVLIREGYKYSSVDKKLSDIDQYVLFEEESLKIYGDVSAACDKPVNLIPAFFNDTLFMFERFQQIVRYSTNGAQSWKTHHGVQGRVGAPVGNQVAVCSDSSMYILGYDGIYAMTYNTDVRWSSNTDRFSANASSFTSGKVGEFRFIKLIDLPSGVAYGSLEAIGISEDHSKLFVAAFDTLYTLKLTDATIDVNGHRLWESNSVRITGNANAKVKNLVGYKDSVYAYVYGLLDTRISINPELVVVDGLLGLESINSEIIVIDPASGLTVERTTLDGVYKVPNDVSSVSRVYGNTVTERALLDPKISNLSRSSTSLIIDTMNIHYMVTDDIDSVEPPTPGYGDNDVDPERVDIASMYVIDPLIVTNIRSFRRPLKSIDGLVWFSQEENYHYESQYQWFAGNRVWVNYHNKICVIGKRKDFEHQLTNTSEVLVDGKFTFYADNFVIKDYPGYAIGVVFYRKDTKDLIGYFALGYRTRDIATFTWIPDRTVLTAILASNEVDIVVPEPEPDSEFDIIPPLEPLAYQFLPSHFIQTEPLYVDFVSEYLKFLSSDVDSDYGQLHSLLRNHDVNETAYLDMFKNDLSKRNVYLDKSKWVELLKLTNNRSFDIYSIKGIKDAYTFLFKLLYNEEVIVSTEADSKYEFDIIMDSSTLTSDLVGNRIRTANNSGQADVVYYERYFDSAGKAYWQVTLNNIIGEFVVGDVLDSDVDTSFTGVVYRGVAGKEKPLNNDEYLQRGPTYYAISVQSTLQVSKYKDDVIRFIHPVGFGFIGILLISMFINSGVSTTHQETIIDLLQSVKWDTGLPRVYPAEIPDLNVDGSYKRDQYGVIQYKAHPQAGLDFPLTPTYMIDNPTLVNNLNAAQRRKESYLFDSSNMRFIETRKLVKGRLKDGLSQRKDS